VDRSDTGAGPQLLGAVLCGGQSRRFGSNKALAPTGTGPLGKRSIIALRDGGVDPVIAVGGEVSAQLEIPGVSDLRPGLGPLGGIATALLYAKRGHVLVLPCALVHIDGSHIQRLVDAVVQLQSEPTGDQQAVVASLRGKPQYQIGCWPAAWGRDALGAVDNNKLSLRTILTLGEWRLIDLPSDAFADADTPQQLSRLIAGD